MALDPARVQEAMCRALCVDVRVHARADGRLMVETPFVLADGDAYAIFLEAGPGGVGVTDCGHTLMHLSYRHDVDRFREGTRGRVLERIVREAGLSEDDGEFYIDTSMEQLGTALFRFGQAITRINDLTFLRRARVESTFYEDLQEALERIVDPGFIQKEYVVPTIEKADEYPVDYRIEGVDTQVFLFGIPNRDKARLTTIVLEHLLREHVIFESLLVFANQQEIPRADLARLSNAGGEMVSSLSAREDLARKLKHRARLPN
jgi:hypothetical protein